MRLVKNWRTVIFRSWAVWAGVVAAILGQRCSEHQPQLYWIVQC